MSENIENTIVLEPDEQDQRIITHRYFYGYREGSTVAGFINGLTNISGIEFTPEIIKELVLTFMAVEGNKDIAMIQQPVEDECDCPECSGSRNNDDI